MENNAMVNLDQFYGGTSNYWKHWLSGVYTDGIKHVAEECGAYWLIDAVMSHRKSFNIELKRGNVPCVVTLKAYPTDKCPHAASLSIRSYDMETGDGFDIELQFIEFTDFPFDRFEGQRFSFLVGFDYEARQLIMSLKEED